MQPDEKPKYLRWHPVKPDPTGAMRSASDAFKSLNERTMLVLQEQAGQENSAWKRV